MQASINAGSAHAPHVERRATSPNAIWQKFAPLIALVVLTSVVLAAILSRACQSLLQQDLDRQLLSMATAVAELLAGQWPQERNAETQSAVRRIGQRSGLRLTLIATDGSVIADSHQASVAALGGIENHGQRTEFVNAMQGDPGVGVARRASPTEGQTYRYLAVRVGPQSDPLGVVRASAPTALLTAEISRFRSWTWALTVCVAGVGALLAYFLSVRLMRPLSTLAATASALASGDLKPRPATALARSHDELGVIARSLTSLRDQLDHQNRQLRRSNQTQSTVLESMHECVIAVGRDERILFANAAAGGVLGFDAARADGQPLLEVVRSHELRTIALRALRTGEPSSGEFAWRGKPLRSLTALAIPLNAEGLAGVVLVLRDVSEFKRLEQMRQQFVANASHELKTPLSAIKAYAETLLGGASQDPAHCERFLRRIEEQADRLHELIQDLLMLGRIESGAATWDIAILQVSSTVRKCLADYEPQAQARGIRLANEVDDATLAVRADPEAMRQILGNLVDNAVKYSRDGGTVAIRARAENGMVALEVVDAGPGIPAEHLDRLFERFYRADKARSRELGGTGLGLSIVKHLCHSLGGSVSVASEVNRGSTFTVRLPRSPEGARAQGT